MVPHVYRSLIEFIMGLRVWGLVLWRKLQALDKTFKVQFKRSVKDLKKLIDASPPLGASSNSGFTDRDLQDVGVPLDDL